MLSQRMWRAIGIAGTGVTSVLLLGITKGMGIAIDTNLFNTGLTPGVIFGVWSGAIAIAIYRNKV